MEFNREKTLEHNTVWIKSDPRYPRVLCMSAWTYWSAIFSYNQTMAAYKDHLMVQDGRGPENLLKEMYPPYRWIWVRYAVGFSPRIYTPNNPCFHRFNNGFLWMDLYSPRHLAFQLLWLSASLPSIYFGLLYIFGRHGLGRLSRSSMSSYKDWSRMQNYVPSALLLLL